MEGQCLNWKRKRVIVTGGASFIGSHLVEKLVSLGATVRVADNLSSGKMDNIASVIEQIEFVKGDLRDRYFCRKIMGSSTDVVFHLAASHGGRGYIDTHPAECCNNMALDQTVFEMAHETSVDRVCYASSACVYPTTLQTRGNEYLLREEDADPFVPGKAFADREYGWSKLMGEMSLKAYHKEYGMKTSSVRIFTAYGERENESHAIIALIAKAFIEMDPYEIWGTGEQKRNFTYVGDIVDAIILASEKIVDGSPVNAGVSERIKINDAARTIFKIVGWKPRRIFHDITKPVGVFSRAADLTTAKKLLGWKPKLSFEEGLRRTIKWYYTTKEKKEIMKTLGTSLYARNII